MRTPEEIVKRIEELASVGNGDFGLDFFGAQRIDLIYTLPYEYAKPFINEEATEELWNDARRKGTSEEYIKDYMEFAWSKANGCRGLSASRSIDHFEARLWLHGDDELCEKFRQVDYGFYGKDKLIFICEHFGWDWKQWDDGVRSEK